MVKMSKKEIKLIFVAVVLFIVVVAFFMFKGKKPITFVDNKPQIEIHSSFDAKSNIEKVEGMMVDDVVIDTSKLKIDQLGTYEVTYLVDKEEVTLQVEVVDTKKPTFTVLEGEIDLGMELDPNILVTDVKDETKTKVFLEKEPDFNEQKDYKVTVVVEDEAGNQTKKETVVHVLSKDKTAPELIGVRDLKIRKGSKVDYLSGISASDNRDPNPKITVNSDQVDLNKLGDYEITYTVKDRSGNKTKKKATVSVVEKVDIGTNVQSNEKIVYLTFDDGPSPMTPQVLDILDRYHAKATFFVTGANPSYAKYIKIAHDKGHTIGMHTYSHNYASVYASVQSYYDDLNKISELCKQQLGFVPAYIRFPGGGSNMVSKKYCPGIMSILTQDVITKGFQYYDWNGDTEDGSGKLSVDRLVANAKKSVGTNNIVMLSHDALGKQTTIDALPQIIEFYQSQGYTFKAIDDNSYVPHHHVNN